MITNANHHVFLMFFIARNICVQTVSRLMPPIIGVDDQLWQVWKNWTIRFAIPEHPVLAFFRTKPRKELNLKI
jgi:hypothetical protein